MEFQKIRYHPLVDIDSRGTEKVPLFFTTDCRSVSSMYLEEMISGYFRLYSKEPVNTEAGGRLKIHCPQCSSNLMQIAKNSSTTKLGLYTCDRCR